MKSRGTGPIDTRILNQVRLRILERMGDGLHGELWKRFWISMPSLIQTRVKVRVTEKALEAWLKENPLGTVP